jgi:hypothetical protein
MIHMMNVLLPVQRSEHFRKLLRTRVPGKSQHRSQLGDQYIPLPIEIVVDIAPALPSRMRFALRAMLYSISKVI